MDQRQIRVGCILCIASRLALDIAKIHPLVNNDFSGRISCDDSWQWALWRWV
jgi:hypothetical protein